MTIWCVFWRFWSCLICCLRLVFWFSVSFFSWTLLRKVLLALTSLYIQLMFSLLQKKGKKKKLKCSLSSGTVGHHAVLWPSQIILIRPRGLRIWVGKHIYKVKRSNGSWQLDPSQILTIRSFNFSTSIFFFLPESLIQTQPKNLNSGKKMPTYLQTFPNSSPVGAHETIRIGETRGQLITSTKDCILHSSGKGQNKFRSFNFHGKLMTKAFKRKNTLARRCIEGFHLKVQNLGSLSLK